MSTRNQLQETVDNIWNEKKFMPVPPSKSHEKFAEECVKGFVDEMKKEIKQMEFFEL